MSVQPVGIGFFSMDKNNLKIYSCPHLLHNPQRSPTKCFTFWCRLLWRKNNLNLALAENQLFLCVAFCCVWLSKASIDVVCLPQALIDEFSGHKNVMKHLVGRERVGCCFPALQVEQQCGCFFFFFSLSLSLPLLLWSFLVGCLLQAAFPSAIFIPCMPW